MKPESFLKKIADDNAVQPGTHQLAAPIRPVEIGRWKARHPAAAALLQVDDILIDMMRGRSSTWTRIRVNLRHVPEGERPAEEPPDPDYDPWRAPNTRSSS